MASDEVLSRLGEVVLNKKTPELWRLLAATEILEGYFVGDLTDTGEDIRKKYHLIRDIVTDDNLTATMKGVMVQHIVDPEDENDIR